MQSFTVLPTNIDEIRCKRYPSDWDRWAENERVTYHAYEYASSGKSTIRSERMEQTSISAVHLSTCAKPFLLPIQKQLYILL